MNGRMNKQASEQTKDPVNEQSNEFVNQSESRNLPTKFDTEIFYSTICSTVSTEFSGG